MSMMQKKLARMSALCFTLSMFNLASAAPPAIGAAPEGDAKKVAEKTIKKSYKSCKMMEAATRKPDGTIKAVCSGIDFIVFTTVNPNDGSTMALAMNCSAARTHLNIAC